VAEDERLSKKIKLGKGFIGEGFGEPSDDDNGLSLGSTKRPTKGRRVHRAVASFGDSIA
jgi:hypothetical protein